MCARRNKDMSLGHPALRQEGVASRQAREALALYIKF